MKLGMYIMVPEAISTAYFIKFSHHYVSGRVSPCIVSRQWLGRHVPMAMNACNNRRTVGSIVSYAVGFISKESLWVCVSL
jgi:hypothetical protein